MIQRPQFVLLLTVLSIPCFIDSTCVGGAIHIAADRGRLADVKRLLADDPRLLNQKESNGLTPLFLAARGGHSEVVELLLQEKAKIEMFGYGSILYLSIPMLFLLMLQEVIVKTIQHFILLTLMKEN